MDSSCRLSPQVVTLELRSLEQRLNYGSVSAGAMDEAKEAMAKATQGNATGKTLGVWREKGGNTWGNRGEKWENWTWKRLGWF